MSGSGISWAVCKSAPRSRQITTPAPHHSVFTDRMPFLPPNQQRQFADIAFWHCLHTVQSRVYEMIWCPSHSVAGCCCGSGQSVRSASCFTAAGQEISTTAAQLVLQHYDATAAVCGWRMPSAIRCGNWCCSITTPQQRCVVGECRRQYDVGSILSHCQHM